MMKRLCALALSLAILATLVACTSDDGDNNRAASGVTPLPTGSPEEQWIRVTDIPDEVHALNNVVCLSEERCIASGRTYDGAGLLLTTDDDHRWRLTAQSDVHSAIELTCLDRTCTGVLSGTGDHEPQKLYVSRDQGESWTLVQLEGELSLDSPSCGSTLCLAYDSSGSRPAFVRSFDGVSWERIDDTTDLAGTLVECDAERCDEVYPEFDCASSERCWMSLSGSTTRNGRILFSDDQGDTWTERTPDESTRFAATLRCPSRDVCWWAGIAFLASTDDAGRNWDTKNLIFREVINISAIDCPGESLECFAAAWPSGILAISPGEEPRLVVTLDDLHVELVDDISCYRDRCVAVGTRSDGPLMFVRPQPQ